MPGSHQTQESSGCSHKKFRTVGLIAWSRKPYDLKAQVITAVTTAVAITPIRMAFSVLIEQVEATFFLSC